LAAEHGSTSPTQPALGPRSRSRSSFHGLPALALLAALGRAQAPSLELTYRFPAPPASLERELGILERRLAGAFGAELEAVGTAGFRVRVPLACLPEPEELRSSAEDGGLAGEPALAALRLRVESEGRLSFGVAAEDGDLAGTTVEAERERFQAWIAGRPESTSLVRYGALAREEGGPPEGFRWVVRRDRERARRPLPEREFVLLHEALAPELDERDLESVGPASDQLGYPAVSFALKNERKASFEHWTGSIVNRTAAILLDDEVVTLVTFVDPMPGAGILSGGRRGFEPGEAEALIAILSHGRLDAAPRLLEARLVEPPR
jgi:hypothetical protein